MVTITGIEKGGFLGLGEPKILTSRRTVDVEYRAEDLGKGVQLQLVVIPGGTFRMGSPTGEKDRDSDEGPQHNVTIQPFLMGRYAVTQAQWEQVSALTKVKIDLEADPARFKGANRPVERVSWYEAIEFCARLSKATGKEYRLPSEAEWEYACRAGTTTPFYFGETIATNLANYDGNYTYGQGTKGEYRQQTTEVGQFPPNAYGLYDMHGNVYEWCADHWHASYEGAPTDGTTWLSSDEGAYRLLRGGSWHDLPWYCRSAFRRRHLPDGRYYHLGFRVVCASP